MAVEGCGARCSKICLFVLNLCLWLSGCLLIGVGSYVMAKQGEYQELFEEDTLVIVSGMIIGVGCFTFLVSFCGCCGAIKESTCLLNTYNFLIVIIILAEITAGILAFVYSDDIESSMMEGMTKTINTTYGAKQGATEAVNDVQKTFDCCGATNYTDYKYAMAWDNKGAAVPESCCKKGMDIATCQQGTKGVPQNPSYVYSAGCVNESISTVEDHYLLIGIIAMALLLFEILTIVFSCCVIRGISKGYETV